MNQVSHGGNGVAQAQRLPRLGVGTPQGNPTVEPEFRRLLPDDIPFYVTRLTSRAPDARQRLIDYLEHLPAFLASFGTLKLDGFAFACTGSSYFVGVAREAELIAAAGADYPVLSATAAIKMSLARRGARRLALVSPYPRWLTEASVAYWSDDGYAIDSVTELAPGSEDTAAIYALGGDCAQLALANVDLENVDAVLLTGTGMPTMAAIASVRDSINVPVLSSNLCLAQALLEPFRRSATVSV